MPLRDLIKVAGIAAACALYIVAMTLWGHPAGREAFDVKRPGITALIAAVLFLGVGLAMYAFTLKALRANPRSRAHAWGLLLCILGPITVTAIVAQLGGPILESAAICTTPGIAGGLGISFAIRKWLGERGIDPDLE